MQRQGIVSNPVINMAALRRSSQFGGTRARHWRASESPPESWDPFASCEVPWSKPHPMLTDSTFRRRLTRLRFWSCSCLLIVFSHFSVVTTIPDDHDVIALTEITGSWDNKPRDWEGRDPCGRSWFGITCNGKLSDSGLIGELTGDIGSLTELDTLDLSYNKGLKGTLPNSIGKLTKLRVLNLAGCDFYGPIPDLGNLQILYGLYLNSNQFNGQLHPSIGNLSSLYVLDITDNMFTGPIPVSNGDSPGLDKLLNCRHFHFSNNQLDGTIPEGLFVPGMELIHVLFDGNNLSGKIPSSLGLVTSLELVRLDRNSLTGPIPRNINNLTKLTRLHLSNNKLNGSLPNLTGMELLSFLDLSNNSFDPSDVPPSLLSLTSLTTLFMENTGIRNAVPEGLLALPQLQTLRLNSNSLNGTVELGAGHSRKLRLVDLQNNEIEDVRVDGGYGGSLILVGNPYCDGGERGRSRYCEQARAQTYPGLSDCQADCSCRHPSPSCTCAYPYEGNLTFRSTSFSDLVDESNFEKLVTDIRDFFKSKKVPVDSVALLDVAISSENYLRIRLQIFPSGAACFNNTSYSTIGEFLSSQSYVAPPQFGSYFFETSGAAGRPKCDEVKTYCTFKHKKHWVIIGASSIGAFLLAAVIACMAVYVVRRRRGARRVVERSGLFASWGSVQGGGDAPNIRGTRYFSFDEMKRSTGNFSEANYVGTGSYGKVYKGMLETGQLVAIKRAQLGFGQGGHEFKTEIELLSRLHHKNIVSLVGFCFDQGEQILVYEYIPNGNLRDSLSGKSGIHLDWRRRLKTALGISRGLAYLHELADPPLIHRDVKSNNVLLDDRLNAKLADFGLCKSLSDVLQDHVTTQVKGTMGYLDPEYYMTQRLTEKSDVYSFGVLLLELVTARRPIEKGKYIVTEVRASVDRAKDLYGLGKLLDPWLMTSASKISGLERFIDLAMRCLRDSSVDRPSMTQVVKEIEGILLSSGVDPYADQYSSRASTRCNEEGSSGSRAEDLDFSMVLSTPR